MADFTVLDKQDEIYNVIDKKNQGYSENELVVVSKVKHLDNLHDSQVTLIATSGSLVTVCLNY